MTLRRGNFSETVLRVAAAFPGASGGKALEDFRGADEPVQRSTSQFDSSGAVDGARRLALALALAFASRLHWSRLLAPGRCGQDLSDDKTSRQTFEQLPETKLLISWASFHLETCAVVS